MVDNICNNCGLLKKHKALGLCKNCYDKQWKRPMKICKKCNKFKQHHGHGMCNTCHRIFTAKTIICKKCGKQDKEKRKGYCNACSSKIWRKENPNWQNKPKYKKYRYEWEQKPENKLKRKISNLKHPEWKNHSMNSYSEKLQKLVGLNRNQITVKMNQLRADILKRDNNQCQICGDTKSLDAHHIIHKSKEPKLMFNPNNLILLCRDKCHLVVHGKNLNEKIEKNITFPKYLML